MIKFWEKKNKQKIIVQLFFLKWNNFISLQGK